VLLSFAETLLGSLANRGFLIVYDVYRVGHGQTSCRYYLPESIFDISKVGEVLSLPPRISQIKNRDFDQVRETLVLSADYKTIIGTYTPKVGARWPRAKHLELVVPVEEIQGPPVADLGVRPVAEIEQPPVAEINNLITNYNNQNLNNKIQPQTSNSEIEVKTNLDINCEVTQDPIKADFVEEGVSEFESLVDFKVSKKQLEACKTAVKKNKITEPEFNKNLKLLNLDPLVKHTTSSFARLGHRTASIKFGVHKLKFQLSTHLKATTLHKFDGFNTNFDSHRDALKVLFPEKYEKAVGTIKLASALKNEFLEWVSDDQLFGGQSESAEINFMKEMHPKVEANKDKELIRSSLEFDFHKIIVQLNPKLLDQCVYWFSESRNRFYCCVEKQYLHLHGWLKEHAPERVHGLVAPEAFDYRDYMRGCDEK